VFRLQTLVDRAQPAAADVRVHQPTHTTPFSFSSDFRGVRVATDVAPERDAGFRPDHHSAARLDAIPPGRV
jgi:hypothetical protein